MPMQLLPAYFFPNLSLFHLQQFTLANTTLLFIKGVTQEASWLAIGFKVYNFRMFKPVLCNQSYVGYALYWTETGSSSKIFPT